MSEIISLLENIHSEPSATSQIGTEGERFAKEFLEKSGFRVVMANFKTPVGRNRRGVIVTGEIDLIAYEYDVLCFVEVKTRSSDDFVSPLSAIDLRKQRQIIRTARIYRKIFHLDGAKFRYDAVSIVFNEKKPPKIELFRSFFTEAIFSNKSFFSLNK